jgi:hypothetical protein
MTDPTSRQRESAPQGPDCNFEKKNKSLVQSPKLGSTPRYTDRLAVGRNVTLTLTCSCHNEDGFVAGR